MLFIALGTTDFEAVMHSLQSAAVLLKSYSPVSNAIAKQMRDDAVALLAVGHAQEPGRHGLLER